MARPPRPETRGVSLLDDLAREPHRFHFYEAMRRLEAEYADRPRFGRSSRAADDRVRLGQDPSLAFAPSLLSSFGPGKEGLPPRVLVHFFGLFGPNGPLPLHLTEYARDRLRNSSDPTFSRFCDLFHHRFLCLFYRAWADANPAANFDRPEDDRFAKYVGSLIGLGLPSQRGRDAAPDRIKLHHASLLSGQTRHAEGLRRGLADFFKVPVKVEEFVGQWTPLPGNATSHLGAASATAALGSTFTLGTHFWDLGKFRVVLGPLRYDDYERFLPGSESLPRLRDYVRLYAGDEHLWDLRLLLRKEEIPSLTLGSRGRLGWTSWLFGRTAERDAGDLVLSPHSLGTEG